jgi:hypothetical protein
MLEVIWQGHMIHKEASYIKYMDVKIDNIKYEDIFDTVNMVIKNHQRGYICLTDVGNVISSAKDANLK